MLLSALLTLTLTDQFAEIAKSSGGPTGVFAQVIESGDGAGLNETERFPMQSVYKLPIAMAILDQVERKALTLDQKITLSAGDMVPSAVHSPIRDSHPNGGIDLSVRELIRAAIVESDGSASDVLLRLAGGGARVTAYLRALGVRDLAVVTTEREMARDPMAQYHELRDTTRGGGRPQSGPRGTRHLSRGPGHPARGPGRLDARSASDQGPAAAGDAGRTQDGH